MEIKHKPSLADIAKASNITVKQLLAAITYAMPKPVVEQVDTDVNQFQKILYDNRIKQMYNEHVSDVAETIIAIKADVGKIFYNAQQEALKLMGSEIRLDCFINELHVNANLYPDVSWEEFKRKNKG